MDPMGVLANEYVRRLSAEQFAEPPRRRLISRGFRRLAEAVLD